MHRVKYNYLGLAVTDNAININRVANRNWAPKIRANFSVYTLKPTD